MPSILKLPSFRSLCAVVAFFVCSIAAGFLFAPEFTGKDFLGRGTIVSVPRGDFPSGVGPGIKERHEKFREFIFINSQVALITLVLGTACFAYPAIKISIFGFIIGVLSWHIGSVHLFMTLMLPHSLTEIPTVVYYCAVAQSSGWKWLTAGRGSRWTCFRKEFVSNLKLWVCVILPLVLFNAVLEAYVTNR